MIEISGGPSIPRRELTFTATRSGGPGGQNVNKVSTRVTLSFDVTASPTLSDEQKAMILRRLANRINREGVLSLHCREHRTQAANRKAAEERFALLLAKALRPRKRRKKKGIPKAVHQRRLQQKAHRGEIKKLREKPSVD